MEAKTWVIIGLIGGVIAAAGVFLTWGSVSVTIPGWGTVGGSSSGLDIATDGNEVYPYLALAGGALGLLGGLGALSGRKGLGYLLPLGGIIAIAGAGWGFADISGMTGVDIGYGVYVCLAGGVLALLGSLGLKKM